MPLYKKRGNRIRASDKSCFIRFSAGSLLLLFLTVVMLLNLKAILTNGLEIGSSYAKWQRPSYRHAIYDSNNHCGSSGLCDCCFFVPQIPV